MVRSMAAWALVAAAVGWGAAIAAAPLVRGSADGDLPTRLAALTYVVGAFVCHQRPERSFHVAGAQMPVCARCAALYWGGAIGLAGWLLVGRGRGGSAFALHASADRSRIAPTSRTAATPVRRTLFARTIFILGLPIAVTLATSALGLWDPANAFRAISSAPFGVALGGLVAAVVLGDLR